MLARPRLTLAAAESMTCGRVQAAIGRISGASTFFVGGITAYSLDQKVRQLGVDRATARRVNSVSGDIARQMAAGACALFGSDLAVATTGYAEPSPDDDVETPYAWWSLVHRNRSPVGKPGRKAGLIAVRTGRVECPGANRVDAQAMVADAVIAELIAYLRTIRGQIS